MTLTEIIHGVFKSKVGGSGYTYVPPLKEEVNNYYHNLLDQLRNMSIDMCQMVYQITIDAGVREEFKQIILGTNPDTYRILMFIESFFSSINMVAENLVEEEHQLRLELIELKKMKRDITSCTMNAKQVAQLASLEEILRTKVTSEILAESKDLFVKGSKAKHIILDSEHEVLKSKIEAETDRAKLNKEVTANAKDNVKSAILRFFEERIEKYPEHIALLEQELDIALKALEAIDFTNSED